MNGGRPVTVAIAAPPLATRDTGGSARDKTGMESSERLYERLCSAVAGQALPLAVLDLDALEVNATAMLHRAGHLPIRLGSKSIRCVEVLRRVQALSPRYRGLLCYSAREAAWLYTQGFDDLLVAYPTVDTADLDAAAVALRNGARLSLMVDDTTQVAAIAAHGRRSGVTFRLAIDLDMSTQFAGLHFGVHRSPITHPAAALALAATIRRQAPAVQLVALMGYEAQIAGVQDAVPGTRLRSAFLRWLKQRSIRELTQRRDDTVAALLAAGHALEFVNGGGTGSLESTAADSAVTEAAAGSGLYSPLLFDHFQGFHHRPSLYFALQVARRPSVDRVTCSGGGYIASGPAGRDRLPQPALPAGLHLFDNEGAGEVQTPLRVPSGVSLAIGAPVFFRHAKAGELGERFEHFLLLRGDRIVGIAPTYRGQGQCFF